MANRSRITFGIKLRGKLKEKSFGIYELRDIILHVHYCNYSLQGGTKVKVQSNAVNCYIRLNRYFCSALYLRTPFFPHLTLLLLFTLQRELLILPILRTSSISWRITVILDPMLTLSVLDPLPNHLSSHFSAQAEISFMKPDQWSPLLLWQRLKVRPSGLFSRVVA